jgi:beta-glucosidase
MPWINQVPSILQAWYLGSETGRAIASIITGDSNPSGKLPFSFPVKLEDNSAHALGQFGTSGEVTYNE